MKNKIVKVSALAGLLALPGLAAAQSAILDGDSITNNSSTGEQVTVIVNATVSGFLRLRVFNDANSTSWSTAGAVGTVALGTVDAAGRPAATGHREVFNDGAFYIADLGAEVKFSGYNTATLTGTATQPLAGQDVRAHWNCGAPAQTTDNAALTIPNTLTYGGTTVTAGGTTSFAGAGYGTGGPNTCFALTAAQAGNPWKAELDVGLFIGDTADAGPYSATFTFTATAS